MSQTNIIEYKQLKAETGALLSSVGESLGDFCQAPPSQESTEAYKLIDEQIQKYYTVYYELKDRLEHSKLSVAVLALTKSGKTPCHCLGDWRICGTTPQLFMLMASST